MRGMRRQTAFVVRVANEKIRNPNSETRNKFQSEQITEISNLIEGRPKLEEEDEDKC